MATEKFSLTESNIIGINSGVQLEIVAEDVPDESLPWIEGWFELPNGNCVVQKFMVLAVGHPTYRLANDALAYWGKEVLEGELSSLQMSPEFATRYLFPAIVQHHEQMRWN